MCPLLSPLSDVNYAYVPEQQQQIPTICTNVANEFPVPHQYQQQQTWPDVKKEPPAVDPWTRDWLASQAVIPQHEPGECTTTACRQ